MTIVPIQITDPTNPIEVQKWLDANTPGANVVTAFCFLPYFYLITNP